MFKSAILKSIAATIFLSICAQNNCSNAMGIEDESELEIAKLGSLVKDFKVVDLPATPGTITLKSKDSLTAESLRGVKFDQNPPEFTGSVPKYDKRMIDNCATGKAPYIAEDIAPFRFKYFNCEFSYGGWHNFKMFDYAALHGFNIIFPYIMKPEETAHFPQNTKILKWGNVDWIKWFNAKYPGVPGGAKRYDMVNEQEMSKMADSAPLLDPQKLAPVYKNHDIIMLDMEHPVISPGNLSKQSWFPKNPKQQDEFTKRYYDGYAQTYIAPVKKAKQTGWHQVGIYGWQPFGRTWGGLEKATYDEGHNQAWELFGKQIYAEVDLVYNSVYSFYWDTKNVAYTLANIDLNMQVINSQTVRKPLRPYYWPLLHGGGGGDRWWRVQPLPNEEMQAMIAMAFFCGVDGIVCWSWSGTGNDHENPVLNGKGLFDKNGYRMIKDDFTVTTSGGKSYKLNKHDVIKLLDIDKNNNTVSFKHVWKPNIAANNGVKSTPFNGETYQCKITDINQHVRFDSEPVAGIVEGLAMVKPLEYTLRNGKVMIDVPASEQFKKTLPIVRRVKLGKLNVIISYDPTVIYGGKPRNITLTDFDGVKGRNLVIPADQQTRIFVLRDQQ